MQEKQKDELKILFFGLGSIGKKHATILKENYNHELIAYRTKKGQEKNNLKIKEVYDLEEAFDEKPDIAFITNPTNLHVETALDCAKRNIHLFIEKPISHNLRFVDELEKEIKMRKLVSYVAYNLRFYPVIQKIKEMNAQEKPLAFNVICSSYLPNWRPNQNYSDSYSAKKEMGGGVTLDLSHEFDYITWLFGGIDKLNGYCDKISNLNINSEDILEVEILCENDIKGNVHLDYFTKDTQRKIKIEYSDKIIEADLIDNSIKTTTGNEEVVEMYKCTIEETYAKQIRYFFNQYHKMNTNMMNNYSEALKIFKKIIRFKNENCRF